MPFVNEIQLRNLRIRFSNITLNVIVVPEFRWLTGSTLAKLAESVRESLKAREYRIVTLQLSHLGRGERIRAKGLKDLRNWLYSKAQSLQDPKLRELAKALADSVLLSKMAGLNSAEERACTTTV